MDFQLVTLEQMPQRTISVAKLREEFETCTPYDCPSRRLFDTCFPVHSWATEVPDDVPMQKVVAIFWYCMGHTEYLDRFIGFFASCRVASYDVIREYFVQALVKT